MVNPLRGWGHGRDVTLGCTYGYSRLPPRRRASLNLKLREKPQSLKGKLCAIWLDNCWGLAIRDRKNSLSSSIVSLEVAGELPTTFSGAPLASEKRKKGAASRPKTKELTNHIPKTIRTVTRNPFIPTLRLNIASGVSHT